MQDALNYPERRPEIKAVYMTGLNHPGYTEPRNLWVKPDFNGGGIRTYKWNPDYVRKQETKAAQTQKSAQSAE